MIYHSLSNMLKSYRPLQQTFHAFDYEDNDELLTAIKTVCPQALTRMPPTATLHMFTSYLLFFKPK